MIDTIRFPDLKGLVEYGHSLALQVGFYLNTCICMEKGRTYFEQVVKFMHEMGFDTVLGLVNVALRISFLLVCLLIMLAYESRTGQNRPVRLSHEHVSVGSAHQRYGPPDDVRELSQRAIL